MNSREHLAADLETLQKRTQQIGWVAWSVALAVMAFGTPIVFQFLTDHDIPGEVAWLLSLAADGALIVGLIATPVLANLGIPAGWVGTLRYVAGFITWALQTAGSWTATGGPDSVGVVAHSFGPVLLFFAVEAASSFQRKVAAALTEKQRQLENAEQRDADQRARRAEVDAKLRATTAELTAAREQITALTERLTAAEETGEAVKAERALTDERAAARIAELEAALTEKDRAHAEALVDANRKAKEKYAEKLAAFRAEQGAVSLAAYRNRSTGTPRPATTGKADLSDEAAVQMMLTAHSSPAHEWSKNAVRTLTGVGLGRAPRLIELWLTAATEKANRDAGGNPEAVNQ